jgi:hypothetical protein
MEKYDISFYAGSGGSITTMKDYTHYADLMASMDRFIEQMAKYCGRTMDCDNCIFALEKDSNIPCIKESIEQVRYRENKELLDE